MGYSQKIDRLAKTIDHDEEEAKVQLSIKVYESIVLSLDSVAKVTGQTKTRIFNSLMEIGLTELCEALQANRPDLIEDVVTDPQATYGFHSPGFFRRIREDYGNAVQIDLEDAIKEEEEKQNGVDTDR